MFKLLSFGRYPAIMVLYLVDGDCDRTYVYSALLTVKKKKKQTN